jgi:glycosyltransferase involved in cell wall biosynthesis
MKDILYDGQIFASQVAGGINRYFGNIIDRLPQDFHPTLTTPYRENKLHYPSHPNLTLQEYRGFRPHRISNRIRGYYFNWLRNSQSFDILHPTYYNLLTQESFSQIKQPIVLTVYDMIHELFADAIDPQGYTIRSKKAAIQAANAIICISESTKIDLLRYFPEAESKITVTYLASEFSGDWSHGDEPVPSEPYFLYVGSRTKEYKNFDTLLIAFSKAASINSDIRLCVVGSPFNSEEEALIAELKLADRIHHYRYASDPHLAKLYRCSIAFVYPSLYEGFGIPPLEAMACGTAVIAANSSSIPEVIGDAGILFDPKSAKDLADIMLSLLDSSIERDRLITLGQARHQQFSWDKTAAETVGVYRRIGSRGMGE